MLKLLIHLRWISVIAVIGSVVGSLLMFLIGGADVIKSVRLYTGLMKSKIVGGESMLGVDAVVHLLAALDSFLFALILFYFAFGIYSLFLRPDKEDAREEAIMNALPKWLQVDTLGQLKRRLLEVIIVLIAVIFLKDALYLRPEDEVDWTLLIAPISMISIAVVLKIVNFEH